MADEDTDIDDYGLLDTPLVRNMFPDLSVIKREISGFDDTVPVSYLSSKKSCMSSKTIQIENEENHVSIRKSILRDILEQTTNKNLTNWQNVKLYNNMKKEQKSDIKLQICSTIKNKNNSMVSSSTIDTKYEINKLFYENSNSNNNTIDAKSLIVNMPKALKKTIDFSRKESANFETDSKNLSDISSFENYDASSSSISSITTDSNCIDKNSLQQRVKFEEQVSNTSVDPTLLKSNNVSVSNMCNVRVTLESLELFLNRSNRYCKLCLRLFPSSKTLTDHYNAMHNQTVNVVTDESYNKCGIYKKETGINLQTENTGEKDTINKETKSFKCPHCNNCFVSQQLLIDHMYDVIQSKINRNVTNSADNIKNSGLSKRKLPQHYYRCTFCSYYYTTLNMFISHLKKIHKKTVTGKYNKVPFQSTCNVCDKTYAHVLSFNNHVRKFHQKKSLYLKKIYRKSEEKKKAK